MTTVVPDSVLQCPCVCTFCLQCDIIHPAVPDPAYSGDVPRLQVTSDTISIDWSNSFHYNGIIRDFELLKNDTTEFHGIGLSASVRRLTPITGELLDSLLDADGGGRGGLFLYTDLWSTN